jgi:hypothetical protein
MLNLAGRRGDAKEVRTRTGIGDSQYFFNLAGVTVANSDLAKLTVIVRTFERPKAIGRLLKSLRRYHPGLKTLVADDGVEATPSKHVETVRLPSEKGQAACLNALLARVRTPYFLVLSENAEIHHDSQLESLTNLVANDQLDIAGGNVVACRRRLWFFVSRQAQGKHGLLEIAGDRLKLLPGSRSQGNGFWWCDLLPAFFVARTDRVRAMGGWDPELRDDCQEEFFFRAHRHGIRVGLQPAATIWQWQEPATQPADDSHQRLLALGVAKMGLSEMTDLEGRVIRVPRLARAA